MAVAHPPCVLYAAIMVSSELKSNVDQLTLEEKASLACYLLESMDATDYGVSDQEVKRRVHELQTGKVQEIDQVCSIFGKRASRSREACSGRVSARLFNSWGSSARS